MLKQMKVLLSRGLRNPSYFRYYLGNVHPFRERFPSVCEKLFPLEKHLDLGGSSSVKGLHVILRTTDAVLNLNASRRLEAVGLVSKRDVIESGGCSLFPAARMFLDRYGVGSLRVTLVADNLSEEGLALYKKVSLNFGIQFSVVPSKGHGNGASFQTQIDVAMQDADDTVELILEDDYRLDPQALIIPFSVLARHSHVAGVNPHFHPDRLRRQDARFLTIVDGRLYARVPSTCCTFFIRRSMIAAYESKLRLYDGFEAYSVGAVWKREICLAPMGWTLAEHLHRSDLSPVCDLSRLKANPW